MAKTIVLIGALDTKGEELNYVRECIGTQDFNTLMIDVSTLHEPEVKPDIRRREVAMAAGARLEDLAILKQEEAWEVMTRGAIKLVRQLYDSGRLEGIISLGGTMGTSLATAAMRSLPVGLPKLMVSTVASGDTSCYVDTKDIAMIPSITDIIGLNPITKRLLTVAAGAIMGMVANDPGPLPHEKLLIGVSVRGDKMPCVKMVQEILEKEGCELVSFAAIGMGGKAMEQWIEEGLVDGLFDLNPAELTEHLFGGIFSSGPARLEAAGEKGIPQVIAPGSIHVTCFRSEEDVPESLRDHKTRWHNPEVLVVWLNGEEVAFVAQVMADKLNRAKGPTAVLIPKRGFGAGGWDADLEICRIFAMTLKANLKPDIEYVDMDAHINDKAFAEKAASMLLKLLRRAGLR